MPYSTKPDTKTGIGRPVTKYTKIHMYNEEIDLLASFAQ